HGMGWHFNAIGELQRLDEDFDGAAASFLESADLFQRVRDNGAQALVKQNLAFTWLSLGHIAEAETLFNNVLNFWMRGPARHAIALSLIGLAGVYQAKGSSALSAAMLGFA